MNASRSSENKYISYDKTGSCSLFLSEGCVFCQRGSKLVLFLTGVCDKNCFYCPVSEERLDKDVTYANEKKVFLDEDILKEAVSMGAEGTGITGGEPLLYPRRVKHYIKLLKSHFGSDHHIHLYTSIPASRDLLEKLKKCGLDEIRFHPPYETWESLCKTKYKESVEYA